MITIVNSHFVSFGIRSNSFARRLESLNSNSTIFHCILHKLKKLPKFISLAISLSLLSLLHILSLSLFLSLLLSLSLSFSLFYSLSLSLSLFSLFSSVFPTHYPFLFYYPTVLFFPCLSLSLSIVSTHPDLLACRFTTDKMPGTLRQLSLSVHTNRSEDEK